MASIHLAGMNCQCRQDGDSQADSIDQVDCQRCINSYWWAQGYQGALADLRELTVVPHDPSCSCGLCDIRNAFMDLHLGALRRAMLAYTAAPYSDLAQVEDQATE